MRLFDFFDSRKSLARWAAKCFIAVRKKKPNATDAEIIELAIRSRYAAGPALSDSQKEILQEYIHEAVDIHSLCEVIARVELLDHLEPEDWKYGGIADRALDVISKELERLGFPDK